MNTALFLSIGNRIKEQCSEIKHIDLYNGQYTPNMELITKPFPKPAVFIEFAPTAWSDLVTGSQEGDSVVRIHVVLEVYTDTYKIFEGDSNAQAAAVAHYGVPVKVHQALQDYKPTGALGELTRINSLPDHDFDNIIVEVFEYNFRDTDLSADHYRTWVDVDIVNVNPVPEIVEEP